MKNTINTADISQYADRVCEARSEPTIRRRKDRARYQLTPVLAVIVQHQTEVSNQ